MKIFAIDPGPVESAYVIWDGKTIPLTGKWDANAWEPCHKTLANG